MKRLLDLVVSGLALCVLSPIILLTAIAVRVSLGSPVVFSQRRPGRHGEPFTMYKFRSMRAAFDDNGRPLPDAERLTRFGMLLRRTSLDELPELWNVLRGDMSIVGPRPLLMEYLSRYSPEQARRHEVRPGITGLAQISGRNGLSWEQKFALDVWYVQDQSVLLDMKIIARTVLTVLRREGIAQAGQATAAAFTGSPKGPTSPDDVSARVSDG